MKTIITIQHTQSQQHINGMIGSLRDWDLTEVGIQQAHRIGKRLFGEYKNKSFVIYSSDLVRAKHTAEIISDYFDVKPIYTEALREFNLGEAIGKSKEWARNNLQCPVWAGTVDWAKGFEDKPFSGAESKADVWNRVSDFLKSIFSGNNENFIIISHDGTLSILYAIWLGLDVKMLDSCNLSGKTGGLSVLCEDLDGNRIIKHLNDMSYIK